MSLNIHLKKVNDISHRSCATLDKYVSETRDRQK